MNRRGFSLVELIVTIAIIAILLTLATLNFNQWIRKSNVEKEVKELFADLQYVQHQAMVSGRTHEIRFNSASNIAFLRYSSEGDASGTQIRQRFLPYAIRRSTWAEPEADVIRINSRGIMTDSAIKTLCVYSDTGAATDSIVIMQSKFNLGRLHSQEGSCDASNIDLK